MIIRLLDFSESLYMLSNKSFFYSSVQESITRQEISLSASPAVLNHCTGGMLCFKPKLENVKSEEIALKRRMEMLFV